MTLATWVAHQKNALSELRAFKNHLCWLEKTSSKSGKTIKSLMHRHQNKTQMISDTEHSVGSLVHGYGGGSFWLNEHCVWYINKCDQHLYIYDFKTQHRRKIKLDLPKDEIWHLADGQIIPSGQSVCVVERHQRNNICYALTLITPETGEANILHTDHDFYAYPKVNDTMTQLCWISWQNPNMPWQESQLNIAELSIDTCTILISEVLHDDRVSYSQPTWHHESLLYLCDKSGFHNLYRKNAISDECILQEDYDMGEPLWQLGVSTYSIIDPDNLIIRAQAISREKLIQVDLNHLTATPIQSHFTHFEPYLTGTNGKLACIAKGVDRLTSIELIGSHTIRPSDNLPKNIDWCQPECLSFKNHLEQDTYAFFYLPPNTDQLPPLMVNCHGGPTAGITTALKPEIQFWTNLGYAVLDVAYSGSIGYGRAYQERLDGQFGQLDALDCIAATKYLINTNRIDRNRINIKGKSSGGLTALNAIINSDIFSAGIIYYAITDLEALNQETHPFEAHYLTSLVAPSDMHERSPIHHSNKIDSPLLIFQGDLDPIVPISQCISFTHHLNKQKKVFELIRYPEESHGFQDIDTISKSLQKEWLFIQYHNS